LTLSDHDRLTHLGNIHGKGGPTIPLSIPREEVLAWSPKVDTEAHINAAGVS